MSDHSKELGDDPSSVVFSETRAENVFTAVPIFANLSVNELRELIHECQEVSFEPGDILFRQGEHAEGLYLVETGELEVRAEADQDDDEVVLAHIGAGGVVGEMAILERTERSATVQALSETHTFMLSRTAFEGLRGRRRMVAYKLIMGLAKVLGDRRRQTDERVAEVFENPAEHIVEFENQVHELLGRIRKA